MTAHCQTHFRYQIHFNIKYQLLINQADKPLKTGWLARWLIR
jgi:hypothetical protein